MGLVETNRAAHPPIPGTGRRKRDAYDDARDLRQHQPVRISRFVGFVKTGVTVKVPIVDVFYADSDNSPRVIGRQVLEEMRAVDVIYLEGVRKIKQVEIEPVPRHVVQCTT